jgi:hypothetical protein
VRHRLAVILGLAVCAVLAGARSFIAIAEWAADADQDTLRALSAGASLKLPRCLECIFDGTSVASGEISDDHHVLDVPGRDAEGLGKLPQHGVAVVEVGANHQMRVVKLARYQPAVVPPLSQPLWCGEADTRQGLGQACYVTHVHERGPSCFAL